jgi:hypothetical protein
MCSVSVLRENRDFLESSLCWHENRVAKWFFDSLVSTERNADKGKDRGQTYTFDKNLPSLLWRNCQECKLDAGEIGITQASGRIPTRQNNDKKKFRNLIAKTVKEMALSNV